MFHYSEQIDSATGQRGGMSGSDHIAAKDQYMELSQKAFHNLPELMEGCPPETVRRLTGTVFQVHNILGVYKACFHRNLRSSATEIKDFYAFHPRGVIFEHASKQPTFICVILNLKQCLSGQL